MSSKPYKTFSWKIIFYSHDLWSFLATKCETEADFFQEFSQKKHQMSGSPLSLRTSQLSWPLAVTLWSPPPQPASLLTRAPCVWPICTSEEVPSDGHLRRVRALQSKANEGRKREKPSESVVIHPSTH